jgi:hypothetical protein
MDNIWIFAVMQAVLATGVMFAVHALPPNSKYIEPGMARGESIYYALGFAYYAAAIFVPSLILAKYLSTRS